MCLSNESVVAVATHLQQQQQQQQQMKEEVRRRKMKKTKNNNQLDAPDETKTFFFSLSLSLLLHYSFSERNVTIGRNVTFIVFFSLDFFSLHFIVQTFTKRKCIWSLCVQLLSLLSFFLPSPFHSVKEGYMNLIT